MTKSEVRRVVYLFNTVNGHIVAICCYRVGVGHVEESDTYIEIGLAETTTAEIKRAGRIVEKVLTVIGYWKVIEKRSLTELNMGSLFDADGRKSCSGVLYKDLHT